MGEDTVLSNRCEGGRPAFQMAVDDDILRKNLFCFEMATVVVNDSVTREAITKDQALYFSGAPGHFLWQNQMIFDIMEVMISYESYKISG